MGKNLLFVIGGIFAAVCLIGLSLGAGYSGYALSERLIRFAEVKIKHIDNTRFVPYQRDFHLSFENETDARLFEAHQAGMEVSDSFATDGKRSLFVEFAPGTDVTGITFDIIGKEVLDWSDMKELRFDVYNTVNASWSLILRIKSGENYPKRTFHKEMGINKNGLTEIRITREELESMVDLRTISHMNIYMHDPNTTYRVYVDNVRIVKSDK